MGCCCGGCGGAGLTELQCVLAVSQGQQPAASAVSQAVAVQLAVSELAGMAAATGVAAAEGAVVAAVEGGSDHDLHDHATVGASGRVWVPTAATSVPLETLNRITPPTMLLAHSAGKGAHW